MAIVPALASVSGRSSRLQRLSNRVSHASIVESSVRKHGGIEGAGLRRTMISHAEFARSCGNTGAGVWH